MRTVPRPLREREQRAKQRGLHRREKCEQHRRAIVEAMSTPRVEQCPPEQQTAADKAGTLETVEERVAYRCVIEQGKMPDPEGTTEQQKSDTRARATVHCTSEPRQGQPGPREPPSRAQRQSPEPGRQRRCHRKQRCRDQHQHEVLYHMRGEERVRQRVERRDYGKHDRHPSTRERSHSDTAYAPSAARTPPQSTYSAGVEDESDGQNRERGRFSRTTAWPGLRCNEVAADHRVAPAAEFALQPARATPAIGGSVTPIGERPAGRP
jgi:hypothetical protein